MLKNHPSGVRRLRTRLACEEQEAAGAFEESSSRDHVAVLNQIRDQVNRGISRLWDFATGPSLTFFGAERRVGQPNGAGRPPDAAENDAASFDRAARLRLQDRLRDRADFLRDDFRGTFAPFFLASLNPIAIACLRLFTRPPEPLFNVPFLRRCIADFTVFAADFPYLAMVLAFCKEHAQSRLSRSSVVWSESCSGRGQLIGLMKGMYGDNRHRKKRDRRAPGRGSGDCEGP